MKKTLLSKGWTLHAPHFHGQVDLPNDYAVTAPRDPHAPGGGDNGYFVCGNGHYHKDMELDAEITVTNGKGNEKNIAIKGSDAGVLIGHHGDTLDALQYLVNLVANKKEDENEDRNYTKISLDIENYREKRQETLETLARRMSEKVLKYKKSITLEPMSPYERRIIHSAVQNIQGVSTNSIGNDNNRRVVIFLEK